MNVFRRVFKRISRRLNRVRKNLVCHRIQRNACVHVFRKDIDDLGAGPGAALYIDDKEVLRLDCFGEGRGHYHVHLDEIEPGKVERIFFAEKSVEDQIARTALELSANLPGHLATSRDPNIREFKIDAARFATAAAWAQAKMLDYAK